MISSAPENVVMRAAPFNKVNKTGKKRKKKIKRIRKKA